MDSLIVECPWCHTKNRIPRARIRSVAKCGKCKRVLPPIPDEPVHVTARTFEAEVLASDMPVLVDFWAPWCGPCKMIAPDLEKLAKDFAGTLKVVKVNTDENQELAAQFNIQSIPTIILFNERKIVHRSAGALPYLQLVALVKPYI